MSGSANVFDAKIKGVDGASGAFAGIARQMRGLIESTRGLAQATRGLTKASAEGAAAHRRFAASIGAHVQLLRGHIGSLDVGITGIRNSIAGLLPAVGALGAGASLAGIFALTKSVAEASVEMEAMLKKVGLNGKEFGGLAYAAKVSAVPIETLTGGLEKLNKTVGLTIIGKNKIAAQLFTHLGISLKDASGHARSTAALMPQLADAFMKTRDPAMQAFMATTLFGKSGQELLPVLLQGSEALKEFAAEGAKLVYAMSPEQKKGLKEFEDQWIGLEMAAGGFKKEIGAELAPVLSPLIAMVKEWVLANRHWLAQEIAAKVKLLAEALKLIDLKAIVQGFTDWIRHTGELINHFGGLKVIIGALALALGSPLLGAVASAITIFGALGRALMAMGALALANPLVAIAAAIAVSALLIWYNWDWLKVQMQALFEWFAGQSEWVKAFLRVMAPFIFLPLTVMEYWQPLKTFFTDLADRMKFVIDGLRDMAHWAENGNFSKLLSGGMPQLALPGGGALPSFSLPSFSMPDLQTNAPGLSDAAGFVSGLFHSIPGLFRDNGPAAQAATAAPPQTGEVKIKIEGSNLLPGTIINSASSGIAQVTETNVGYVSPMPRRGD